MPLIEAFGSEQTPGTTCRIVNHANLGIAKLTPRDRGVPGLGCRQIATASSQDAKALRRSAR